MWLPPYCNADHHPSNTQLQPLLPALVTAMRSARWQSPQFSATRPSPPLQHARARPPATNQMYTRCRGSIIHSQSTQAGRPPAAVQGLFCPGPSSASLAQRVEEQHGDCGDGDEHGRDGHKVERSVAHPVRQAVCQAARRLRGVASHGRPHLALLPRRRRRVLCRRRQIVGLCGSVQLAFGHRLGALPQLPCTTPGRRRSGGGSATFAGGRAVREGAARQRRQAQRLPRRRRMHGTTSGKTHAPSQATPSALPAALASCTSVLARQPAPDTAPCSPNTALPAP